MKEHKKQGLRCPYCGAPVHYRSADGIYHANPNGVMLYVCGNYPTCDAYVRTHQGTKIPVGSLADGKLRALRKRAHDAFNQLYLSGLMSRDDAYRWLAGVLQAPQSQAHIGLLSEYYCRQVVEESERLLKNRKDTKIHVFDRSTKSAS
jgi:ssDNA-binding Zn-finger/Zn-ribbon topoisomerase 1